MSTALGKRKERDEEVLDPESHGSTLFVSNLPYTATSVDLQTLFSDIAPVRSAFVVTESGTGVSKGVGYVAFSVKEDAQEAFDTISKNGISLVGRNLRVQWADTKPKEKGEKVVREREPKAQSTPRVQQPRAPHDPFAIRTIVASGLPPSIDSKVLWKKFRKYAGAEKVDWPVKGIDEEDDPTTAHVLFHSPSAALDAVNKLHAHVYKGSLLSVTLKKRLDTLSKPTKPTKPKADNAPTKASAATTPSHASRLIVRNIPFNITEQDLRAVFLPYGPIHSINIPTFSPLPKDENEADDGKTAEPKILQKGFAFVWMLSKKEAEKAIEGCNGMVLRAGMAEGLLLDKKKKKKQRRLDKKLQKLASGEPEEEGDDEEEDEGAKSERTIAVDWALSKSKWEEEKAKLGVDKDGDVEMEDNSDDSDDSDDSDESGSELGVHDGEDGDSGSEGDSDDDDNDSETPVKPELPPPETGTTLFIRNVPFSATEDELRTLFRAFGPLRYARITMDPSSGRSRGTGFACFWNKEDAGKVIEQSELLKMETGGLESSAPKKNPFTMPSILTPDPSSSLAKSLVLQGRTLDVVQAVTRDDAGKLKEEGERRREKADKRNMYLLREGVIMPNTPAAATLSSTDVERRTVSFNSRKTLLKSNPSLYISRTRLSIRQIPIFVTERMLKRLASHAVRAFKTEVKKGVRAQLTQDELTEVVREEDEDAKDEDDKATDRKGKKKEMLKRMGVKQAKIVRQQERVDPVTGKGRSKGYGFLEMHKHADALRVLRWSNNNPEVGPLFDLWWKEELEGLIKSEKAKDDKDDVRLKRMKDELESGTAKKGKGTLIVEFSIENVQVVQRRNTHQKDYAKPAEGKRPREKLALRKSDEPPSKKPRKSKDKPKDTDKATAKTGNNLGSLIGRKRRERKGGKK